MVGGADFVLGISLGMIRMYLGEQPIISQHLVFWKETPFQAERHERPLWLPFRARRYQNEGEHGHSHLVCTEIMGEISKNNNVE